jgi:hypothetical protein
MSFFGCSNLREEEESAVTSMAEMRARAQKWLAAEKWLELNHSRIRIGNDWDTIWTSELLAQFAASERDRARELACGAVCEWCREGKPLLDLDPIMAQGKKWHKPFPEHPDDPQRVMCQASAIRQAFEEER